MKKMITEVLRNQFDSTFHMARVLVKICPSEIWANTYNGVPFWQQVFHYVYYIDFWMRVKYDDGEWRTLIFDDAYTTDLYADNYDELFISQDQMLEYLDIIQTKTTCVFDNLNDEKLSVLVWDNASHHTYADVIVGQIRHIMYNVGYLNGILRELGLPESDWYAYNEP